MKRLIDVDRTMINYGFEWDDITPTADEFCDFLMPSQQLMLFQ